MKIIIETVINPSKAITLQKHHKHKHAINKTWENHNQQRTSLMLIFEPLNYIKLNYDVQ